LPGYDEWPNPQLGWGRCVWRIVCRCKVLKKCIVSLIGLYHGENAFFMSKIYLYITNYVNLVSCYVDNDIVPSIIFFISLPGTSDIL